jgi:hypothetical protein
MTENMRVWDALKTTNPKYTKKVEFGRKFTSINSQWQLQRMTEQFGPIGKGWGYDVIHNIERIRDDYVLAIADVTIWWGAPHTEDRRHQYGPIRGMCPLVEKGKNGIHDDDDAGKKAMTDALTKGLSHLGLSADVFLGLYDDNKYVQSLKEQFPPGLAAAARLLNAEEGRDIGGRFPLNETPMMPIDRVDPADRDLVQGDGRSTYEIAHAEKSSGRLAAELWASQTLLLFTAPGYDLLQYKEWKHTPCTNKGTKTNYQKLMELREKHPDLVEKLDVAVSDLRVVDAVADLKVAGT